MDFQNHNIVGTVKEVLPSVAGGNSQKQWVKQDLLIESVEKYPKLLCLTAWNDNVHNTQSLETGDKVEITFVVEAREWNGKYFTNVTLKQIKVMPTADVANPTTTNASSSSTPIESPLSREGNKINIPTAFVGEDEDIPF